MIFAIVLNLFLAGIIIVVGVAKTSANDVEPTQSEITTAENEIHIVTETTEDTPDTNAEEITIVEMTEYEEGISHQEMLTSEQSEEVDSAEIEDAVEDNYERVGDELFYYQALPEDIKIKISGCSYPADETGIQISYDDLAYLHVLHYDFEQQIQEGEIICNRKIAQDLLEIFKELYEQQYEIEKIKLIDEYGADDDLSMENNNTSCFNYRTVAGKTKLSNHAYGLAIDINPRYNPYVALRNGVLVIGPENGADYIDRSLDTPHKIDENDLCYQLFSKHGFTWGGSWINSKDYQHFEKKVE